MKRHNGLEEDHEGAFVYFDDHEAAIAKLKGGMMTREELDEKITIIGEKDAEIDRLKNELKKLHRIVGEDETTIGKEYLYLSDRYNAIIATAAEKDAEIARLKEWQQITIGAGTDQETVVRMAATEYAAVAKQCWEDKYNDLMATAVRFAELIRGYAHWFHTAYREADDFLESPPVQEWRKRQKEGK